MFQRDPSKRRALVVLALALIGWGSAALAQARQTSVSHGPLAGAIREHFEVLPIRDGVVLRPLAVSDVVGIEVSEGDIAIDGEVVDAEALSELVGEPEASLLLRLAALDSRALHDLFAPPAPPVAPAPPVDAATATEPVIASELDQRNPPHPPTAPPAPRHRDRRPEKIREGGSKVALFGSRVVIEADEVVEEVVSIAGSAVVHGRVLRDVVAVGGSVDVTGQVEGSVTAIGGPVTIGPEARVDGEVTSIGSNVIVAPGGEVGRISEVNAPWVGGLLNHQDWGADFGEELQDQISEKIKNQGGHEHFNQFSSDLEDLVHRVVFLVALWLLGCLGAMVAPKFFRETGEAASHAPFMAPLIGVLTALLFFPLIVVVGILLVISIVGIPLVLLLPFVLVAFGVLWVFGFTATTARVGALLERRLGRSEAAQPILLALGLVALGGFGVAARLVDLADGRSDLLGFLSGLLGFTYFCAMTWACCAGLGGLLLNRFQPIDRQTDWAAVPGGWPVPPATPPPAVPNPPPADLSDISSLEPEPRWTEEEFLAAAEAELEQPSAASGAAESDTAPEDPATEGTPAEPEAADDEEDRPK